MLADIIKREYDLSLELGSITKSLELFLTDLYRATASFEAVAGRSNYSIMEEIKNVFPSDVTICDVVLALEKEAKTEGAKAEAMRTEAFFKNKVDLIYKQSGIAESYPFKQIEKEPTREDDFSLAI